MSALSSGQGFRKQYDWGLYPQTEDFLRRQINQFLKNNRFASDLAARIERETATRFFDWIDHIVLPENSVSGKEIEKLGFRLKSNIEAPPGARVLANPEAIFFPLIVSNERFAEIALKPERLDHFVQMTGRNLEIEGGIHAPYRKSVIYTQGNYVFSAVERRGYNGFVVPETVRDEKEYARALETFLCRERHFDDDEKGTVSTKKLMEQVSRGLARERLTDAFFRAERLFWERRNWAGQVQKARQDRLGLGWGNHDHHTYRSSRENFATLVGIFEYLGFVCREQFYAGEKAGWGAQILAHPVCNIVVFADVDISRGEKDEDFAHRGMEPSNKLATVGLWVALHGESLLQAGMHHLAARFDFERLRADLKRSNVNFMNPFSYFEFLKQAFSEPERWEVNKERLAALLRRGAVTKEQYNEFLRNGAVSGHLENIQRDHGFKGFNQESVSAILKATDPRKYLARGA